MVYAALKVLLTAGLVVAISEVAKRSTVLGGIIASLPLTSLLALIWLYGETGDAGKVASLSTSIFWYVLPSLVLFLALPALLARGLDFWPSLAIASGLTFVAYLLMTSLLARFGVTL
ncbi:MAG: DUF3147 family protein [Hyphomicrobium sp.]